MLLKNICVSSLFVLFALFLVAGFASAHEVYVLDEVTVQAALNADSQNPFLAYFGNEREFFFWGLVSFIVFSTILFASVFRFFEERANSVLIFIKRFAQPLVRFTVATTLLAFAGYGVIYGPELPLKEVFGGLAGIVRMLLALFGAAIFFGTYTRAAALGATLIYIGAAFSLGAYALTYLDHLGAYILLLLLGGGAWSYDGYRDAHFFPKQALAFLHSFRPLAYPLLRISFGVATLSAAIYGKYLYSELAVEVVLHYDLTRFFAFDPLFIVLGAFIIESLAAFMIIFGVGVRWTALFLAFWLTMGHIYTNEFWWVHIILYGVALAIFCHGYDRWSLEGRFLRRNGREPVL